MFLRFLYLQDERRYPIITVVSQNFSTEITRPLHLRVTARLNCTKLGFISVNFWSRFILQWFIYCTLFYMMYQRETYAEGLLKVHSICHCVFYIIMTFLREGWTWQMCYTDHELQIYCATCNLVQYTHACGWEGLNNTIGQSFAQRQFCLNEIY